MIETYLDKTVRENKELSQRLKELRENRKMNLEETAKAVDINSISIVKELEDGRYIPNITILSNYAKYFDVSIKWILTGKRTTDDYIDNLEKIINYVKNVPNDFNSEQEYKAWSLLEELGELAYSIPTKKFNL